MNHQKLILTTIDEFLNDDMKIYMSDDALFHPITITSLLELNHINFRFYDITWHIVKQDHQSFIYSYGDWFFLEIHLDIHINDSVMKSPVEKINTIYHLIRKR